MNVSLQLNPLSATLCLCGPVDQPMAMQARQMLDVLRCYYQYEHVIVEINSPGGELLAFKAIHAALDRFRLSGGTVATTALLAASSAAAFLLALGDLGQRTVQPYTELLFHHSRVMAANEQALTAVLARRTAQRLKQADDRLVETLAAHIARGCGDAVALGQAGLARCVVLRTRAAEIHAALGADAAATPARLDSPKQEPRWLKDTVKAFDRVVATGQTQPYAAHLEAFMSQDARMPVDMAWALHLVDRVEDVPALQPEAVLVPALLNTLRLAA